MEKFSASERRVNKIIETFESSEKTKRDVDFFISALANSDYPFSNIENFQFLFDELVKYETTRRVARYTINNSKVSFPSNIIPMNIDGVELVVSSMRENSFPPDRLSSLFTDDIRSLCMRKGSRRNSLEAWSDKNHMRKVVEDFTNFNAEANVRNLRQSHEWICKKCNNFPINVALEVYMFFQPRSILDLSAGWGDRAIAAGAWREISKEPVKYTGLDPNTVLKDRYTVMFEKMGLENEFKFHSTGSEDWEYEGVYDLIFTSPPYFDLEIYAYGDSRQSVEKYKDVSGWVENYFVVSFSKAWDRLETGGNMVIVMEDSITKNEKNIYTETSILLLHVTLPNNRLRGVLPYTSDGKKFRPMFCFEKITTNTNPVSVENAKRELSKKKEKSSSLLP